MFGVETLTRVRKIKYPTQDKSPKDQKYKNEKKKRCFQLVTGMMNRFKDRCKGISLKLIAAMTIVILLIYFDSAKELPVGENGKLIYWM